MQNFLTLQLVVHRVTTGPDRVNSFNTVLDFTKGVGAEQTQPRKGDGVSCNIKYTGCFIMFSVITDISNKKTNGPILMEFFTATGTLKKFFFDN